MNAFKTEIKSFLATGEFNNNLDDSGNIILVIPPDAVNKQYVSYSLKNWGYDAEKVKSLYDVEIKEFSVPETSIQVSEVNSTDKINQLSSENDTLREQLNALIVSDSQNHTDSDFVAAKEVIINLRIQLGEGKTSDDFSDVFPYIKK